MNDLKKEFDKNMTQQTAESNLHEWFWLFKHKLVDEYPEFSETFDYMVGNANDHGLLYEVMEFAYRHLQVEAALEGGEDNLTITDYLKALDYGYDEWIK
jgi:hypothetical protein